MVKKGTPEISFSGIPFYLSEGINFEIVTVLCD